MIRAFFAVSLGLALGACQSAAPEPGPTPREAAKPAAPAPQRFGGPITLSEKTDLAQLLDFPEPSAGKLLLVEGTVRRNCTKKGCWMELASGSAASAPSCRVTFKDYGFFVPTDSQGAHARVEGRLLVREMDKAEVDHLEAEGAHFDDKSPDGTVQEVRLVANAVELTKG